MKKFKFDSMAWASRAPLMTLGLFVMSLLIVQYMGGGRTNGAKTETAGRRGGTRGGTGYGVRVGYAGLLCL
ncbi:hypothetical protein HDR63_04040 [bacterium]|nr:hypothetical protein [bacterium]